MSSERLFLDPTSRLPDIPHMNHTLLFIETNREIPIPSNLHLGQRVPEQWESFLDSDISIDLPLKHPHTPQETGSTPMLRKKKNGCICRKTKCLKLYCECFSSGKTCTEDCSCHDCSNDPNHTAEIIKTYETLKGKTTAAKHNHGKGCNCKKTQCRKKYCECFNAGTPCNGDCKCEDCANGP